MRETPSIHMDSSVLVDLLMLGARIKLVFDLMLP